LIFKWQQDLSTGLRTGLLARAKQKEQAEKEKGKLRDQFRTMTEGRAGGLC
jgi:hypothetical protein